MKTNKKNFQNIEIQSQLESYTCNCHRVFAVRSMPHQRYNFWLFVCVLFTSWLIRRRRRRRRQHVHTFPGILKAFDFWSTFNLTGCVSELRLVTLSDLSFFCFFFLFFVLLLLYSFFVLLIKHKKKYHQIKLCFRTSYFRAPDKCIACPFQLHDKCATR